MRNVLKILPSALLLLAGCGYQFQGSGSILPDDVKKIAIGMVDNETTEPGLGPKFTEILRSRFERYGVVEVVDDPGDADAILKTSIRSLNTRVTSVTGDTDVAVEQELVMTVSSDLKRRNGQVLWRNDNMQTDGAFANTGDTVVTSSSQFAQGGISSSTLGGLGAREISRGQQEETLNDLMEEAAKNLYLQAVASDF